MLKGIYKIADGIIAISKRIEGIAGKIPEIGVVILYTVLHFVMTLFHEPWFDEAVAWQIARSATLSDILFKVPHYEGHPQLWHLILLPFAKTGLPYEMSLALVTILFAGGTVFLIVFKSPFPRIIRCLLPFTYFLFYQYGVIARPYCVTMLAFMLLSATYKKRNTHPGRYALSLALLCATSALGIVIAGGIALAWLIEIWERKKICVFLKGCFSDRRIWWLALLFLIALFFVISIIPAEDTFATNLAIQPKEYNPAAVRVFYMLFVSLPDVLLTDVYGEYKLLSTTTFSIVPLLTTGLIGALILAIIGYYGKMKKTALTFFLPHLLLAIAASLTYMNIHHLGIVQFLFFFWLWVSLEETKKTDYVLDPNKISEHMQYRLLAMGGALCMCVLLFWNASACVLDVEKEYAVGRSLAGYIKENNLDSYNIMVEWQCKYDEEDKDLLLRIDTNYCPNAMDVAPYFERNIFYNFADGKQEGNYISHIVASEEDNKANYEKWRAYGKPDVLLMSPALNQVWTDGEVQLKEYIPVYSKKTEQIWKMTTDNYYTYLYVRNDLAKKLGLKTITVNGL